MEAKSLRLETVERERNPLTQDRNEGSRERKNERNIYMNQSRRTPKERHRNEYEPITRKKDYPPTQAHKKHEHVVDEYEETRQRADRWEVESPEDWDRLDDLLRRNPGNRKKSRQTPNTYHKTRVYRGTSSMQPSTGAEYPQISTSTKMAFPTLQSVEGYYVIKEKAETDKIIIPKVIKAWVDLRKIGINREDITAKGDTLLVKTRNKRQSQMIGNLTSLGGREVEVNRDPYLNSCKGIIYRKELLQCTDEELLEGFQEYDPDVLKTWS